MVYKSINKPLPWRLSPGEKRLVLQIGDILAAMAALVLAVYIWAVEDSWLDLSFQFVQERIPTWYILLPIIWLLMLVELYDNRRSTQLGETLQGLGIAAGVSLGIYLIIFFLSEPNSLPRLGVAIFLVTVTVLTLLWRFLYIKIFTAPFFLRRVFIIGAGRAGSTLVKILNDTWPAPFYVIGLIDDDPKKIGAKVDELPILGGSADLGRLIQEYNISDLIFSISGEMKPQMFQSVIEAEEKGTHVTTMPVVYEELLGRVPIFLLQSDWILRSFIDQSHTSQFYEILKRLMDILGGAIGCIIGLFLLPFLTVMIAVDSGFPILYRQVRLGKSGQEFTIIKFRTMLKDAEKDGKARPASENDQRITRTGRLLRKSHLDEIPQFINILRGEMSLVGPRSERPEIVEDLQQKIPFYRARLLVKPGLTGWAQINFGYADSPAANAIKLEYDLYYIQKRNLVLDFTIMIRTLSTVIGFRGR